MKLTKTYSYTLNSANCSLDIYLGNISASDDSDELISLYVGDKALNAGIAKYLKGCSRDQQESFMQTLTDHIRKTDNAEA